MPLPRSRRSARWSTTFRPIPKPSFSRVILIVLDSVGCGELPDAAAYGDEGSNTLGNIARSVPLRVPHLRSLGLDRVVDLAPSGGDASTAPSSTAGAFGRMAEA